VDDVAAAALRVTARSSLDQLTVRAVATELGVTAPAVHYYVNGRDDLVRRVVETVAAQVDVTVDPRTSWSDQYVALVLSMDRTFLRYPGVGVRALTASDPSAAADRLTGTAMGILGQAGFAEDEAVQIFSATYLLFSGWLLIRGQAEHGEVHPALQVAGLDQPSSAPEVLEATLRRLLAGWGSGTEVDSEGRWSPGQ
jgi:AcrR family transcriptional regulator